MTGSTIVTTRAGNPGSMMSRGSLGAAVKAACVCNVSLIAIW
jgi:hypothetical protein